MDVRVQDLHNQRTMFEMLQNKDPKDRINVLHQLPVNFPPADAYITMTEFNQPPYGCGSFFKQAKFIITGSNFCKKVFENFTDAPVHVIHYPPDPQYKPTGAKYKFNHEIEKFSFKFLSVFEWCFRKDPYTLIKAFKEEFSPDEDCCLILRCWSKFENPRKWIGKLAKGCNVFWIPDTLPQLAPLYRSCDCFVTSTLGEGFGHPIAEAMASGLKVITPKSTGMLDYCNNNNTLLVKTEEKEVQHTRSFKHNGVDYSNFIKPYFKCWEPDIDDLKLKMRKAFKNEMRFIRDNAVKIKEKYSYENIEKEIRKAFNFE